MTTTDSPPTPDPSLIFETLNAHQRSSALKGAIELEIFTGISAGSRTLAELAERSNASQRGVRILCDFLTVHGFLTKKNDQYGLTDVSAKFLDKRSPAYLGDMARFLHTASIVDAFSDVTELVRRGSTLLDGQGTVETENDDWVEFARSMAPMMAPAAEFIGELAARGHEGPLRTLDIAAGHGLFGIAIAQRYSAAEIVAVDWANVLEVAEENAVVAGIADRYRSLAGDAFEVDLGGGYDLVLLTNFLHHFDVPTCEALLHKVHRALKPGGRVITLEFVPNEDRVSPPVPATFAFTMLGTTPSGDAYTFAEYERMFRTAGFERNEIQDVERSAQQVIVSHR